MTTPSAHPASPDRNARAAGALVGTAVGDALGAPFEFDIEGVFTRRFPTVAQAESNGMCGGRGWSPGEATDDTQMALHVALSLLERGGLDPADVFARFQRWALSDPMDIGLQTEAVLRSGLPWDRAADNYAAHHHRAAGNGSLMRAVTGALYFASESEEATGRAARVVSGLTHGDPATGEGCMVFHRLIRVALDGGDPLDAVEDALAEIRPGLRERWAVVLAPDWLPEHATEFNGAVWPALGSALWALRSTGSYAEAVIAAVDSGGDTDTVAAITGGLAGAVYGIGAVPAPWRDVVHVPLPGAADGELGVWRDADLVALALRLAADRG
ncbi:ADP-ribosylglycohydrolase family protein [Yinghuangia seranimata]|uniref:ADP-ribosylglycohydrolase family protein n=1 Tax=Yinghuangia seranimata TaxID=408067 RepID=UPI00248CF566|nr:ADP-ribosylglycohydrolase family protein [Yinghuangia seranimata]MDI2130011.1 ADP-ribosylglycohydrolase family protein [Yinghuangia seranimata]